MTQNSNPYRFFQRKSLLSICASAIALSIAFSPAMAQQNGIEAIVDATGDRVEVFRAGVTKPLVTQIAKSDFRPYLHPIAAPDLHGELTEFSPDHHKHQNGLYWGFPKLNGRDYFHHPEGSYWKRVSVAVLKPKSLSKEDSVQWQTIYDLLDDSGATILRESQLWTMRDFGDRFTLDLEWSGDALADVTVGKYDYGGLFLRMPWKPGIEGQVINNARQINQRAEGQRAVWLDVSMKVPGRNAPAHIAIFDHPQNKGFPQHWRVDDQLGVGPVRARAGDWKIAKGQREIIKHQLVISSGPWNDVSTTEQWAAFTGQPMAYAQWSIAQQEGRRAEFLTPEKAIASMTMQDGFEANVYASEPMIGQPMAFCWDAKGRLWIAENFDYETRQTGFANDGTSRITILEDKDRDGIAESRKTFVEGIPFPAGIAVGMGGLWLGAPPNLLFIPDKDGDDRADMNDIQVRLTGWGIRDRHETLNSFIWGPDGWLYGTQGYATPSKVGKPKGAGRIYRHKDAFPEKIEMEGDAIDINGGVWRYHPTKDRFEVVAHGFSNPWGIDYDAKGQLFITACVIPHLWHVIPGGIYHRQGGTHFNPYVYSDIRTIADHAHQSAHGGARVYQSDAFPSKYQGRIFMANIHEHAVLTDVLERKGSGFIGHHGDDFLHANNAQWIGFSMEVGPDGSVYVLDWHDADICGKEVLNKNTGRVFRISPKKSTALEFVGRYSNLYALTDLELAKMQMAPSVWHATHARIILQHRATQGSIAGEAIEQLNQTFASSNADHRLRAMWTLHAISKLTSDAMTKNLADSDEHIRAWAIQLLCEDNKPSEGAQARFVEMARSDTSPVVRLYLASSLGRMAESTRWRVVEMLATHAEDTNDHNIPKMIWFGLEPQVMKDIDRSLTLAQTAKIPLISRHIIRRLGDAEKFDVVVTRIVQSADSQRIPMLLGLRDALEGRFDVKAPPSWSGVYAQLSQSPGEVATIAKQLSQQFGDKAAAEQMLSILKGKTASADERNQAIRYLAGRKRFELKALLMSLIADEAVRKEAIRAVAAFEDVELAKQLLRKYQDFNMDEKQDVLNTLATRARYGAELTNAIRGGTVPKSDVPAHLARLLRRVVGNSFVDVWGPIDELSADKDAQFVKYREMLKESEIAKGDPSRGRAHFNKACATCHKLYDFGRSVGPDITGANRSNLEYLLSNILTPSAIIQDAYKMQLILTHDGRTYAGIPTEENERQLKLLVADRPDPITIAISEIESRQTSAVSMMPEGSLSQLKDQEILDLFAYLQSTQQQPLPP